MGNWGAIRAWIRDGVILAGSPVRPGALCYVFRLSIKESYSVASHHHWTVQLSGHPLLDHQHQELARLLTQLEALLGEPAAEAQLLASLTALDRLFREHFRCEEQLMAEQQYPQLDRHRQHHHQIAQQADALLRQYHKGQVSLAELVSRFLQEVAAPHIREEDADLLRYLQSRARS